MKQIQKKHYLKFTIKTKKIKIMSSDKIPGWTPDEKNEYNDAIGKINSIALAQENYNDLTATDKAEYKTLFKRLKELLNKLRSGSKMLRQPFCSTNMVQLKQLLGVLFMRLQNGTAMAQSLLGNQ